tara:strand:- start:839 stop:1678 length:840 start_codon:yes stop_codon:yes gene_type:complete
MAQYFYLIPNVTIAPPPGYQLLQTIPGPALSTIIDTVDADLLVTHEIIMDGRVLASETQELQLRNGSISPDAGLRFAVPAPEEADWFGGAQLGFLETKILATDSTTTFHGNQQPGYYTVFSGSERKTFFLDNTLKFSDPVTINQIAAFGLWVEGYPACVVDTENDVDCSFVLINPFERPAVVTLEYEGIDIRPRFKIEPLSARRISFADQLGADAVDWRGQVYVHGRNRVAAYFVCHSFSKPDVIHTIEHTDAYRGRTRKYPFTQSLYLRREQSRMLEG